MVTLAIALSAIITAIADEHTLQRRPPWHTWLASLGVIGASVAIIAAFVWVGCRLPD